ncbi:alanine dehydrogenase [Suipraeoptans intestinalis]|uniref:Alanine dehydrogenase n=1 Tax=Suipraeoptans intestinalis TaxID=2606628 RepID=A0A6N7V341_9FIRM|nr:alanine dehydrogenase [Suipraeoptans intestinalis]MDD7769840.1 alanine dehydrogenase [Suipraeoptans intestinalis]MDY3120934.1 alanine dehydrogenase [Suipraeoptans intestinalis]MSR94326.1 alanine dehydrogenase [Suipraeoptans intestinalis]
MKVGCVKEIKNNEFRVGMTPDNVKSYVNAGHEVLIEKGAGIGSGFTDDEYAAAGAKLIDCAKEVWDTCEMMIKVKEPLPEEYDLFHEGLILYTYLHLAADKPQTDALLAHKVKGVAYETLIERNGSIPLLAPMSQIAGRLSIQEGAKYLEKIFGGEGVLLSGVPGTPKAKVVILGGGSVGTNACKIAVGMGADVTIMDINLQRLAYLDDIFGARIQTLVSTDANIEKAVKEADLVIGSVLIPGKSAPKLFKKEYLKEMKPGSVFVDVAVDQGGCGETTKVTYHDDPIYVVDGVVHYCVGNMPGAVPRTSTIALTNATLSYGLQIANKGLEQACKDNDVIYSAINTYDGKLTCKAVADSFEGYEYVDVKTLS